MKVRHVIVRGRVQGVGYRAWVQDQALRLDLEGWVRNRRDGAVEAVFAGAEEAVAAALEACHRGPPAARVDAVEAQEAEEAEKISPALLRQRRPGERFSVLHTA
jgi:acylphosphatase